MSLVFATFVIGGALNMACDYGIGLQAHAPLLPGSLKCQTQVPSLAHSQLLSFKTESHFRQ